MEGELRYCDVIVRSMAGARKIETTHAATGKSFAEIARERAAAAVEPQHDRQGSAAEEVT